MIRAFAELSLAAVFGLCGLATAADDAIDRALSEVGLTKETAVIDRTGMGLYGGDEFVLDLFTSLHRDPYRLPEYTEKLRVEAMQSAGSLQSAIRFGALRTDEGVRRGWLTEPLAEWEQKIAEGASLVEAVEFLLDRLDARQSMKDSRVLRRMASDVPEVVADSAALVLYAALDAADWRKQAFSATYGESELERLFKKMPPNLGRDGEFDAATYKLLKNVDLKLLQCGAADLAEAVTKAVKAMTASELPRIDFHFECDTPMGKIVINGSDDDYYHESGPYLLIIDTSGDDIYHEGGATVGCHNPVSVLIDLDGRDLYKSETAAEPAFGVGIMGYGYLVDVQGSDRYDSPGTSQGVGILGVGALLDMEGNDEYKGVSHCQGVGIFGVGVLSDLAGNDAYNLYTVGQGYGGTKGAGILVDLAGRDTYTANDTDIRFPSSQTAEHNSSEAQGAAFGRRADYTDGHSLAGGLGMLVDGEGDDKYSCGVFGQGVGYWYGVGILADGGGDDEYAGVWYVQGSGAHFACGVLNDAAGSDKYTATMHMAMGAGHDFTVGYLVDAGGNDVYDAPSLALGAGNANGLGVLWDKEGDDTYNVSAPLTLGEARCESGGGLRDIMLTLGLFVDGGGSDTYPEGRKAANGSTWVNRPQAGGSPKEVGVGIDE